MYRLHSSIHPSIDTFIPSLIHSLIPFMEQAHFSCYTHAYLPHLP